MKRCNHCGKLFVSTDKYHPHQKYCSKNCRISVMNKKSFNRKKQWNIENFEKVTKSKQKWLKNNPEKRAKASDNYRRKNSAYYTEYSTLRSRNVKQAKPKWLSEWDLFYIQEFYDLAKRRRLEVDHIIPIRNDKVCGLHVPSNLQMLSRSQNAMKSNKFHDEDICAKDG